MSLSLESSVQYIPRVGLAMAEALARLDIFTVRDILYHIPARYNDYSLVSPIGRLQAGETVTIRGTITSIASHFSKSGKKVQEAQLSDDSGTIRLTWFNQPFLVTSLPVGTIIGASGTVSWFGNKLAIPSPEYEILGNANQPGLHTGRLVPVYPLTEGVSAKWLRGRTAYLLETLTDIPDPLPDTIRETYDFLPLTRALHLIHFPETHEDHERARARLAFDELFTLQLTARYMRRLWETTQTAPPISFASVDQQVFEKSLPFELTSDQKKVIADISGDLAKTIPMNRLVEGDVGSGKTVVAAAAMFAAWKQGFQSLLMAPTQILAEQHYKTLTSILGKLGMKVRLVTGGQKGDRGQVTGDSDVFVGTHALLNETIQPDRLGLVIIDEQQRFGVRQRHVIRNKGKTEITPHLLTMTATPIPRTIALTMYGNLDLSAITQAPVGRKRVKTWVVPKEKRDAAYAWIRKQLKTTGAQAFIVCPLIETSETLTSVRAVTAEFDHLSKKVFPDFRLGLLHGRMKAAEKTDALAAMHNKKIDILVTTPVVEVGIDIPNATIMFIEAAERFGLSQLHQLRGRVGRGTLASYCLLFTEATDGLAIKRLKAMETLHSGPLLAEVDLTLRGPGELLGTRQHGVPILKIATFNDTKLIEIAQKEAIRVIRVDPDLTGFTHLRGALKKGTIEGQD